MRNQIEENMTYYLKSALATALLITSQLSFAATQVQIKTNQGNMTVELFDKEAPISSQNFVQYAKSGHYNNTIFHRVIPGFMIQGGGYTATMQEKPTQAPIKNEANNGQKNLRGTLAMARTQQVNSATSQFFINLVDNSALDHGRRDYGYAVFGKVIKGMDVVDKIAQVKTGNKGFHQNVPINSVVIQEIKVIESK